VNIVDVFTAHPSQIETGIGTADPSLPYPVDTVKPMSYGSNPSTFILK